MNLKNIPKDIINNTSLYKENNEIDTAWECLEYAGFIKKSEDILLIKGSGIVIFKFFQKEQILSGEKKNCEMYHAPKGNYFWDDIYKISPEIFQKYDPILHIFICIQIPCDDNTFINSMRLYSLDKTKVIMESRNY